MLVYLIRRLGQSLLVVAVMATMVFLAVYAVGDPIDILANPDADQQERAAIAQRLGLDRPLFEQFGVFILNALRGDLGRSFVYNVPAVEVILQRLPGDPGARPRRPPVLPPDRRSPRRARRPQARILVRPHHHVRLDPRLLPAELLDRPDADPALRRRAAPPARQRPRADRLGPRGALRLPDLGRPEAPHPAGLHARALQVGARDPHRPGRHARGDAAGLHPLRPRQGAVHLAHRRRARPEEHHDPGRDRARAGARLDDRLRGRDRDGVRLSRHGQAPDRLDQPPRPPDHRRLPDDDGA